MATTIPNIPLSTGNYIDVYSTSGIAVGSAILIQNKGKTEVNIQVGVSQPSPVATLTPDGVTLEAKEHALVEAGEDGIWAIGIGTIIGLINVQGR